MVKIRFALVIVLSALVAAAQTSATQKLPVRHVVLYKNGVGYFEHAGQVHGSQDIKIDFTSGQLNDVLKSLTVLDLNGGKIAGVGYNSVAPLAEQLKSLRLPLGESTTLAGFLNALRGARVEVRSGAALTSGRLLSVEEKITRRGPEETGKALEISLVTPAGDIRSFVLSPAVSVRIADRDLNEEIAKYLSLVGSERDRDLRQMSISTIGTGDRNIFVSYISEVPVWKSTYRIILPTKADAEPLLQGWAIVDNTVGEDWNNVELSLVAGAPQSFIEELSKPYYTRRPVVAPPETAMLTPQTHEGTLQEEDQLQTYSKLMPAPPPPMSAANGIVGGVPGGLGSGIGGGFRTSGGPRLRNDLVIDGQPAADAKARKTTTYEESTITETVEPAATAQDLGDLFQYDLKQKVTILKNHSALVPIINSPIKAEKVTLWNSDSERPLRALWITNSSGLTLDGGTFNVMEDNAFAGEGLIDPLKPGERRLLSYAVDQGVRIEHEDDVEPRPITHIKIANGVMTQTREERDHQTYTIRNTDSKSREVIIEHPRRDGWKLADGLKPEETSASFYRFRVKVQPDNTAELKVDEVQPVESEIALSSVTDDQIKLWFNDKTLKPDLQQALGKIMQQKSQIAGLDRQLQTQQTLLAAINLDQQRLRENMKVLKGSAEEKALLLRYTRELNDQENKLQATRAEMDSLSVKRVNSRRQLDQMLQQLTLDETI